MSSIDMDQKLLDKMKKREKEGTLRSLSCFEGYIDFFSNDYLSLSKLNVFNDIKGGALASFGATGSRLISGTSNVVLESEKSLASFFNSESALHFNSGFDANIGFFSSIPQRGDTIIYDEYIHASVRDGIRLSFAKSYSFSHNNPEDLERVLIKAEGSVYVAVEGLYSMDGDLPPLRKISDLCDQYSANLIVDEAHSAGVFGENGKGFVNALNIEDKVFARLVTFGKAYGGHGAIVLGSNDLIQFLINFARSFMYTTALPDSSILRNSKIVKVNDLTERKKKLQDNLQYFRTNFNNEGLISESNSPIQILEYSEIKKTKVVAKKLQNAKIAVKPIFSPTVAVGKERLRLCFHSGNTFEEIDQLIDVLKNH